MKNSLFALFLINVICYTQEYKLTDYENKFFVLDFEKNEISMSEFNEYFFTTFPHEDPTAGNVIYDRTKWSNEGIIKIKKKEGLFGYVKLRKDKQAYDSFRLTSKPFYNLTNESDKILFVFKGEIPSAKGLWPAWWLNGSRDKEWLYKLGKEFISDDYLDSFSGRGHYYNTSSPVNGTDWPSAGEVDIIETINGDNIFYNTIHTCPNMCDSEWNGDGIKINCANSTKTDPNKGCSGVPYKLKEPKGTFACLWENNQLTFYYWDNSENVRREGGPLSKLPKPELWTKNIKNRVTLLENQKVCTPENNQAWQCTNCEDRNSCKFVNLKMIFNITICGKWAGNEFDETDNAMENCSKFVLDEGSKLLNNKYMKMEYVSVKKIN